MERPIKPQDIYIRQKRLMTALFVVLFLGVIALMAALDALVLLGRITFDDGSAPNAGGFTAMTVIAAAFIVVYIVFLVRLLSRKFMLVVDSRGIDVRCTFFNNVLIPWSNIVGVEQWGGRGGKGGLAAAIGDGVRLAVELRDVREYKKSLNRIAAKLFLGKSGLVFIGLSFCKGKARDICSVIKSSAEYYTLREFEEGGTNNG